MIEDIIYNENDLNDILRYLYDLYKFGEEEEQKLVPVKVIECEKKWLIVQPLGFHNFKEEDRIELNKKGGKIESISEMENEITISMEDDLNISINSSIYIKKRSGVDLIKKMIDIIKDVRDNKNKILRRLLLNNDFNIPTEYKGYRFRSRLEARWAAFFDLLNWKWEYEPRDFNGWIPDFALIGKQVTYVEIKPITQFDQAVADKIDASGCKDECLILGLCPSVGKYGNVLLGWLREIYYFNVARTPNFSFSG